MQSDGPPVHFLNLEYFFRLIYDALHGTHTAGVGLGGILTLLSHLWLVVTVLAYLACLGAIGVLVYSTTRLYQINKEDAKKYETIGAHEAHEKLEHSRWDYITQLIESGQESDWRAAIIEADIMLDELLDRLGYQGESVGEKLKAANPAQFQTLNNAWDAHRVRNDIAHSGSQYQLSEHVAHRTIANYEAVFREHHEI
jgi:hypothetical protein